MHSSNCRRRTRVVDVEEARAAATLDAILSDHIPVLTPYRPHDHEAYGPFGQVVETIRELAEPAGSKAAQSLESKPPLHLWIPDDWSLATTPGAFYLDALAGKFDMRAADRLLKVGPQSRSLRSGTRITRLGNPGDRGYTVQVTTRAGKEAVLERFAVHRGKNRIPQAVHQVLFGDASYGWPLHLGSGFFLRRTA